uniref:Uncharacterized protein n=1 Tax=Tetradesmus obliquus TaxID=3088 RepID=A0A383VNC2_TETOB|eukprot:jgi/Sobl393_1/4125/SZX66390.1
MLQLEALRELREAGRLDDPAARRGVAALRVGYYADAAAGKAFVVVQALGTVGATQPQQQQQQQQHKQGGEQRWALSEQRSSSSSSSNSSSVARRFQQQLQDASPGPWPGKGFCGGASSTQPAGHCLSSVASGLREALPLRLAEGLGLDPAALQQEVGQLYVRLQQLDPLRAVYYADAAAGKAFVVVQALGTV